MNFKQLVCDFRKTIEIIQIIIWSTWTLGVCRCEGWDPDTLHL